MTLPPAAMLGILVVAASQAFGDSCLLPKYDATSQPAGTGASDFVSTDLDLDGDLDVLIADTNGNRIRVLRNHGGLGFSETLTPIGAAPVAIGTADVDGDGDSDALVALRGTNPSNDGLRLMRNDGAGSFTLDPMSPFPPADSNPVSIDLVDLNGDGSLDVAVGIGNHSLGVGYSGGIALALGDGAGGFSWIATHELPLPAKNLALGDFNADGRVDAAEIGGFSLVSSSIVVALGNGDGTFTNLASTWAAGLYASALAVGDWDGDGDDDIASGGKYSASTLISDGTGSFTTGWSQLIGYYVKGITAADLDGDGDVDLAATSGSSQIIAMLRNDGSGGFAVTATLPCTVQCYAVMLADTSGDGFPDPWAIDITSGVLTIGTSHCAVKTYGEGKPNSSGCVPHMEAIGAPSISGGSFQVDALELLPNQPAILLAGTGAENMPALGGSLLVTQPWVVVPTVTASTLAPPCQGAVHIPLSGVELAALGSGVAVFVQALSLDPFVMDGTSASLTDGLMFEVLP